MFKLNNKGFAVSAVLYTLLIAFLMFLGVTLAQFSSSISLINNANKDLVDGQVKLSAEKIIACDSNVGTCTADKARTDIKVQIKSKYGTMYWPKDILTKQEAEDKEYCITDTRKYKNIETQYDATNKKLIIRDIISCPDISQTCDKTKKVIENFECS